MIIREPLVKPFGNLPDVWTFLLYRHHIIHPARFVCELLMQMLSSSLGAKKPLLYLLRDEEVVDDLTVTTIVST